MALTMPVCIPKKKSTISPWASSHKGIAGKESIDEHAKVAATTTTTGILPRPTSFVIAKASSAQQAQRKSFLEARLQSTSKPARCRSPSSPMLKTCANWLNPPADPTRSMNSCKQWNGNPKPRRSPSTLWRSLCSSSGALGASLNRSNYKIA